MVDRAGASAMGQELVRGGALVFLAGHRFELCYRLARRRTVRIQGVLVAAPVHFGRYRRPTMVMFEHFGRYRRPTIGAGAGVEPPKGDRA